MGNIVDANTPELKSFIEGAQSIITDYFEKNFPILDVPTLEHNNGRRYYRVERIDNQRSVHAFIDRTNGDVLKAASWKAPAKHARGNIFDENNGLSSMGPHGPAYLK